MATKKQKRSSVLAACLALVLVAFGLPKAMAQTVEDGTEEHPFLIESKQELLDFSSCMTPGNKFYHDGSTYHSTKDDPSWTEIPAGAAGTYFKLTCDVVINTGNVGGCEGVKDPSWEDWNPIQIFSGHFDGDFHIVSGLYVNNGQSQQGFFTQVTTNGSVSNLGVVNSYIAGTTYVGGITGWLLDGSTIDKCFFEGTVESTDVMCGGIVGISEGSSSISNCYTTGQIFSLSHEVGGIVGYLRAGNNVTNCYSTMMVMSEGGLTGGVYGYNLGTVTNCYWDKQMCTFLNSDATGKLTVEMCSSGWTDLGSAFTPQNGFYPYLTGFGNTNPSVKLSIIPVFLNSVSGSIYDDMSNLHNDFSVGNLAGATWSATSWNNCITMSGTSAHLEKQGVADLLLEYGERSRTYILYPNVAPYLGEESNPFTIDNLKDLTNFRNGINGGIDFKYKRIPVNYSNMANIHWLQTADIDMASVANWTPVGNSDIPYRGYYHGGDHTISNLTISSTNNNIGLFGYKQGGRIENLELTNAVVKGASYVAALCGYDNQAIISNCRVIDGNVKATNYGAAICGRLYGGNGNGVITHCKNVNTSVTSSSAGGICGYEGEYGGINNCYNSGFITGTAGQTGGICGCSYSSKNDTYRNNPNVYIKECLNEGQVVGKDQYAGIAGLAQGYVFRCINTAEIIIQTASTSAGIGPGGILGWGSGSGEARECINTGNVVGSNLDPEATGGILAVNGAVYHSFNCGHVNGNKSATAGISGKTNAAAYYSLNVGSVTHSTTSNPVDGIGNGTVSYCLYDKTMCTNSLVGHASSGRTTSQLIGTSSVAKSVLGTTYWIYEEGLYPRLKWTDTCDWAREIAIAAATPVLVATETENVDNVKPGLKLYGCDSSVVWKQMPQTEAGGCLFVDLAAETACSDNAITPTLNDICVGTTTIGAYIHDTMLVKTVTLRRFVEPVRDTLDIDNLADLQVLQEGVNSDEVFYYKGYLLPRYADSVTFRVTDDIAMPNTNWTAIGGVSLNSWFGGNILGEGHTISNLQSGGTYAGLFGRVRGTIQDLDLTSVSITSGTYKGAVCAQLLKGKIANCTVRGSITGGTNNTGGIVGYASGLDTIVNCSNYATISCTSTGYSGGIVGQGNSNLRIIDCANYANVTGSSKAGGILGYTGTVKNCHNEGTVSGSGRLGGIIGDGTTAVNCYNLGKVVGASSADFIGGICGVGTANYCYNVGDVTAQPGNSTSSNYVGGICGQGSPSYCYNAGIVFGNNRKYVGGIVGTGAPSYCYNSNMVRSSGSQLGGIAAVTNNSTAHCYYDKQMCPVAGGMNGVDVADKAEGMSTEDMLGTGLQSVLGTASNWQFTPNFYPQLSVYAGSDPSLASVMPILLQNDEVAKNVHSSFYMKGCDVGEWNLTQGVSVRLDTVPPLCEASVVGVGIVKLESNVGGRDYKTIRLIIGISEDAPYIIKNLTELKNFRDVINQGGFYNMYDSTYHLALTHADSLHLERFAEIQDGGLDLFFKLVTDIDMTGEPAWQPIGNYATNTAWLFQGSFNGDDHVISNLTLDNANYRGLFGRMNAAVVKNLHFDNATITGNGEFKGVLCGLNYGGKVFNCSVENSSITGASKYTGALAGGNYYADMFNCHATSITMNVTGAQTGGLCGRNDYGLIDTCYVDDLTMTGSSSEKGGVVGLNERGTIRKCDWKNSSINVSSNNVGGILGYNYAETSGTQAVVSECVNENSTISNSSSSSGTGGIVGYNYNQYSEVNQCVTRGGTVTSAGKYTGGIAGYQYYNNSTNFIVNCRNENKVEGKEYTGGICGYSHNCYIDSCQNYGLVKGSNFVGGIYGHSDNYVRVRACCNVADVTATGSYVGGLVGSIQGSNDSWVGYSYNVGNVSGANKVGGLVGYVYTGYVTYCYNAGVVKGISQVGGAIGHQSTTTKQSTYNYNIGFVEGVNIVGGFCGFSHVDLFANNFYDLQMSPHGGVNDADQTAVSGKLTTEMLGNGLQPILGDTYWTYEEGMYPRLKIFDTTRCAIASVMPVYLPVSAADTVKADDVPVGHYTAGGCDSVSWTRISGYGISVSNCEITATGRNYVKIANIIAGDTIKTVEMVLGISEENPLEIVSLEQLKKFRNLINSNQTFYYDQVNMVFYADPGDNYVKIDPCGENMFFKLTTDIDLSIESTSWTPIGDYATNSNLMFKGHFNGAGHTITGLSSTANKTYQGLFGYLRGVVKNLNMDATSITGTGNFHGAIAGFNYGTILNCHTTNGIVRGTSYVGGIAGRNDFNQIAECYNSNDVSGTSYVGGVSGTCTSSGLITKCFNMGIVKASAANSYVGGIAGYNEVYLCYCYNVGNVMGNAYTGGITGWSGTNYLKYCYNVGNVISTSTTYVGAISSSDNASNYPYNCCYDRQTCVLEGGIGYSEGCGNSTNRTTAYYTENMLGTALQSQLGTETWTYVNGEYPKLTCMASLDASIVSTKPVLITEHLKVNEMALPFTAAIGDGVEWSKYGRGHAVNYADAVNGNFGLIICGNDTLKVSLNNDSRLVPVYVEELAAATLVDTTCEGFYLWAATGRIYTESVQVSIALSVSEGCDSVVSLDLTIPPAINIDMASQNYTCYESTDAYAEATVTGGFEEGYYYYWISGAGDTISRTNRIDDPGVGTYHLSVRDKKHIACEKATDVTITRPTQLQASCTGYDSRCFNSSDGYIALNVQGGTLPYTLAWSSTDNKSLSTAGADTIVGLAAGTYTVTVTDGHNCENVLSAVVIADDETEYAIASYGESKMYDAIAINPGKYTLTIDGGAPVTINSGEAYELANGDTLRVTVSATTPIVDAGTTINSILSYSVSKDGVDKTCRYNIVTTNNPVVISKRDVVLTSASDNKHFDATPLTNHHVTISGSGFIGTGQDTLHTTVTGTQTNVGSSNNTFTYDLTDATNPDNYAITTTYGQLVVATDGKVVIIANSDSKMYDGTPLTNDKYTYVGNINALDTVLATVAGTITDAGSVSNVVTAYEVVRKTDYSDIQTANYDFDPSVDGTLTVTPRNITLTTVSDSKVYDGTAFSRPTVTVTGDGIYNNQFTYSATTTITNYGNVTNAITVTPGTGYVAGNYNITKNEGTLSITKRPLPLVGENRTVAYNGGEQTSSAFTASNLLSGHALSGITYLAAGTNPSTYTGAFSGTALIKDAGNNDVTANYEITPQPGTLTITGNALPLVVKSNSNSVMYDGQPHTYQNYTVLYNGESMTPTSALYYTLPTGDHITITPKDAGTGITHVSESGKNAFEITLENESNYTNIVLDSGMISIAPRPVELRSPDVREYYTGTAIPSSMNDQVERLGWGFVPGEGVSCTMLSSRIDVGSEENNFSYAATGLTNLNDYDIEVTKGTLRVDPLTLTIAANNLTKTYGDANPTLTYSITGFVAGEDTLHNAPFLTVDRPVLSTTATEASSAGLYPISIDITGVAFKNYELMVQPGTLTVYRKEVTLTANSISGITYDGTAHTWRETSGRHFTVEGLMNGDTVRSILVSGSRTIAGTTNIELSNVRIYHFVVNPLDVTDTTWTEVTQSYEPDYQNGSLTIAARAITLRPIDYEHDFTGTTYNSSYTDAPHFTIVSGTLATNDSIVALNITGSRAAVGSTDLVIDPSSIIIVDTTEVHGNYGEMDPQYDMTGGYNITLQTGSVTINHRSTPYEITMQGSSNTIEYDGSGHNLSGFVTNTFTFDGYTYHVEGLTSKVENVSVAGDHATTITGTAVVRDASNADVTSEFTVTSTPGYLHITQRPLELTAYGLVSEYDGRTHSSSDILWPRCRITNGTSLCGGHNISAIEVTGSRTIPGETPVVITPSSVVIKNMADQNVTANYSITYVDSVIKITDRTVPFDLLVRAKHDTVVYDSETHSVSGFDTLKFTVNENIFTVSGLIASGASAENVGIYKNSISGTAVVKDASNNVVTSQFNVSTKEDTLQITKRPITITANNATKEYDRTALTADGWDDVAPVPAANDYVASVTVTGTQTEVGTSNNVPSAAVIKRTGDETVETGNYDITYTNGTLEVTGNTKAIVLTSGSESIEFDGNMHKKEVYTVSYNGAALTADATGKVFTLPTGDKLTITPTFSGITNYSENESENNTFTYVLDNNAFYTGTRDTTIGTVSITKKDLAIAIVDEKTYDEDALATAYNSTAVTATGLVAGDALTAGVVTSTSANVGTYTLAASTSNVTTAFATTKGIANYEVTLGATQTITRGTGMTITAPTAANCTKMYDGSALNPVATATVPNGTSATIEYKTTGDWSTTAPSITHVADGPVTVSARAINQNYDTVTTTYELSVTTRPIVLTAGSHEFTYDGEAHTYHVISNSGTYGFVGTDTVSATFATASTITFVNESPVTNTITAHTFTTGAATDYSVTYADGSLTMAYGTPIALTITARDTAWVFDATTHRFHSYTVEIDGGSPIIVPVSANGVYNFANGDVLTATFDANSKITDYNTAGVDNVITGYTLMHGTTNVAAAYDVTVVDGTIRIKPDTITITARDSAFVYDGTAKSQPRYDITGIVGDASLTAATSGTITFPSDGTVDNVVTTHTFLSGIASNYYVKYVKGALTMSYETPQPTVAITAKSGSWTYDGSAHSKDSCTIVFDGNTYNIGPDGDLTLDHGDVLHVDITGSITNQGSTANTVSAWTIKHGTTDVSGGYSVTTNNGTLTITEVDGVVVAITGNTATATYDGTSHTATGYTVASISNPLYTEADIDFSGTASVSRTNAGTTQMGLTAADFSNGSGNFTNVTFTVTDGSVTIDEKPVIISGDTAAYTYDGSAHSSNLFHVYGLVGSDAITGVGVTGSITYVDQSPVANVVDTNSYTFTGSSKSNYDITLVNGQLTMEYPATATELAITAATNSFTYNGNNRTDANYSVSVNGGTAVDVTAADHKYELSNGDTLTVVVSGTICHVASSPVANEVASYTLTNHGHDVSGNYNVTTTDGQLTVTKANVTITAADSAFVYDGSAKSQVRYIVAGLCGTDALTATTSGNITFPSQSPVDNTITSHNFTSGASTDYNVSYVDGSLTMTYSTTPVELTITADDQTWTYDGTAHAQDSYVLSYGGNDYSVGADGEYTFANGDKITVNVTGSITDYSAAGVANVATVVSILHGSEDVSGAYDVNTPVDGTLMINKRATTITANDGSKMYDGTALTADGWNTTPPTNIASTDNVESVTVTGTRTDAGTTPNVPSDAVIKRGTTDVTDNYTITYTNGTLTVDKRDVTLTSSSASKLFDGAPLTRPTVTVTGTGFLTGHVSNIRATGTITNIGSVTNTIEFDEGAGYNADNYQITKNEGTLTITGSNSNFSVASATNSWVYDATLHKDETYTVTYGGSNVDPVLGSNGLRFAFPTNDTLEITPTCAGITDAGSLENTFTYTLQNDAGYIGQRDTTIGTLTVTQRPITLTAKDLTVDYDATEHTYAETTAPHYDVAAATATTGLLTAHTIASATLTGSRTDAGTTPISITAITIENASSEDVTANYNPTLTDGHLTINAIDGVTVTIQEHGAEYIWDGTSKSVSGYTVVSISNALYTTSDFTFSGTATVSGTGSETELTVYPMTLVPSYFTNTNTTNFTNVTFTILDSALYIYPNFQATKSSQTDITCHGDNDGQVVIAVTGGKKKFGKFNFAIDGGTGVDYVAPHTFTNLTPGAHTIVVTDSLEATSTVNFTIAEPDVLTATLTVPVNSCSNLGTYPVSVVVTGGTTDYSFVWGDDATNANANATVVAQTAANDGGDTYDVSVQVTDAHLCAASANTTFTVNPSVTKTGSVNFTCANDTTVVMKFGAMDTLINLHQPTWTSNIPTMPLTLQAVGTTIDNRYSIPSGLEEKIYTVTWHLVDTCGGDSLICTQHILVRYPGCGGTVMDVNGNTYEAQRIGHNCWLRTSMKATNYGAASQLGQSGNTSAITPIDPTGQGGAPSNNPGQTSNTSRGVMRGPSRSVDDGQYKYDNNDSLYNIYGYLYTWYAASHVTESDNDAMPVIVNGHVQGICPDGWAIPTVEDFLNMISVGGSVEHAKHVSNDFWASGFEGVPPTYGFDAKGAGYFDGTSGTYSGLMTVARFWTATPTGSTVTGTAVQCATCSEGEVIIKSKHDAYSVRCVRVE